MIIGEVVSYLDHKIPPMLQESYDNSGFLIGNKTQELTGVLICVDITEDVVDEAIRKSCNLIVSHHPLIFKGLKKIVGQDDVARTVEKIIKNDLSAYAAHTNLDSVDFGVSNILARKLDLHNLKVMDPKPGILKKLAVFCPADHAETVRKAIFKAGAGNIGDYDSCSFNLEGQGSFKAGENSDPFVGEKGELHYEKEVRVETVFPEYLKGKVISAMLAAHPYEEVAYDIYPLDNKFEKAGLGMSGTLDKEADAQVFMSELKSRLNLKMLRHTAIANKKIKKVAVCGGAGSFLIGKAKALGADIFITADLKYHDFFQADENFILVDVGHYESEKYTKDLLNQLIIEKFPNFAPSLSEVNTNPVNYL